MELMDTQLICQYTKTKTTDLVEIGVECCVVSVVELRLFIEDVGQVLMSMGFQCFLG